MAVDTKGFVLTKYKDVFFVCNRIEQALNKLIAPGWRQQMFSERTEAEKANPQYERVVMKLAPSSGAVRFLFTYKGENRALWVNFDCDCDRVSYGPFSINISLSCWGESELLVKTALESISMLGPVYFDLNDCDDVPFAQLDVVPATYLSACADGDELASTVSLKKWHSLCMRGEMGKGTFKEWLGIDAAGVNEIFKTPYPASEEILKAHVTAYKSKADSTVLVEA